MGGGDSQDSSVHGSGQSVNVSVGMGPMVVLCVFLFALMLVMLFSVRSAAKADLRAEAAEKALLTYAAEKRQAAYWAQTMSGNCLYAGVKVEPIPASMK